MASRHLSSRAAASSSCGRFAEKVYGIPPEQVVGSSVSSKFEIGEDGNPKLMKAAKIEFVDDGPGKPVGINRFIGRRPIFAFGNSDGDQQMLEWTASGAGPSFRGSFTTPTPSGNMPTIARPTSASSTRRSTRPTPKAGQSST